MPTSERYYREQIDRHEAAEREAERDSRRAWFGLLTQIAAATGLGLLGLALAFRSMDVDRGWVYWWAGVFVWVGGVLVALLRAYARRVERGDSP